MKDFTVSVRKVTDEDLMREACESTFLGKSQVSLLSMYKSEHSPSRTQLFWVSFKNIPLFISTHLIRHHVGSVPFQLTCRDDRKGGNPGLKEKADKIKGKLKYLNEALNKDAITKVEATKIIESIEDTLDWIKENTDRYTPVNLSLLVNAQSLIDMSKLRLCKQAHPETITVFNSLKNAVKTVDPDLARMMVPKCVYRNGLCGEPNCCGYNTTPAFGEELKEYKASFTNKQCGIRTKF